MAFRSRETMKKVLKNVGEGKMDPRLKDTLKQSIPDSKVIMGRAKRGLFAGRHIQFGNNISEDGGNKTRRSWKPNVQDKRLFSYILDRHIRVKVSTHALRCIDKAGGIDEYLLKTPYQKMDTEMGLLWKAKIEKLYEELGSKDVVFFSAEDESKLEQGFREMNLSDKTARREFRRQLNAGSSQQNQVAAETMDTKRSIKKLKAPKEIPMMMIITLLWLLMLRIFSILVPVCSLLQCSKFPQEPKFLFVSTSIYYSLDSCFQDVMSITEVF